MTSINIADAKARLSELVELASTGERVIITKRGKPVLELSRPQALPKRIDLAQLRAHSKGMPRQKQGAAEVMREIRDAARYRSEERV